MPTIHDAYINALLADATYALDVRVSDNMDRSDLLAKLTTRMTLAQATYIADNFTMVTHIDSSDTPVLGSGFDATVWQGKTDTPYAGKTFVSMTGTEGLVDFIARVGWVQPIASNRNRPAL
jgi:hypothetical protein